MLLSVRIWYGFLIPVWLDHVLIMQTYDVDIIPLLLSTAKDLFENYNVKQFIIAATLRNEATFQAFLTECSKWDCFEVKEKGLTS
jgi:hypothetical protein